MDTAAHHCLFDLVVDGHHAGSGGAGREQRGTALAANIPLPGTPPSQPAPHRSFSTHVDISRPPFTRAPAGGIPTRRPVSGLPLPVVELHRDHVPPEQGGEKGDGEVVELIDSHLHGGLVHTGAHGCEELLHEVSAADALRLCPSAPLISLGSAPSGGASATGPAQCPTAPRPAPPGAAPCTPPSHLSACQSHPREIGRAHV